MELKHLTGYASKSTEDGAEFIMSDATVDRMGDIILPTAWKLESFKKNPIALYQHESYKPIGTWENVRVEAGKLLGDLKLAAAGTSAEIDTIRALVAQGILKAVSVGFKALKYKEQEGIRGVVFTEAELMECSLVSIPANSNALAIAKSFGADTKMIFSDEPVALAKSAHAELLERARASIQKSATSLTSRK